MPRPKAKTATDGSAKPLTAAEQAEKYMRDKLAKERPPADYKAGRLQFDANLTPLWQRLKRSGNCCIGSVVATNPAINPQAALEDHYKHGQKFSVFNPCVSSAVAGTQHFKWSRACSSSTIRQQPTSWP